MSIAEAEKAVEVAAWIPRIGPDSAGISMNPEEFDAIDDWDECYDYELIRGVLVVSPIPSEQEAGPNEEMGRQLGNYRVDHPEGSALDDTLPERYIPIGSNRRKADRVIWAGLGRRPKPKLDVPTIVVEFVSRSRRDWLRDYVEKRAEYLGLGVIEYWIIDRFRRTLTVYRSGEPAEQVIPEAGTYQTPLLPGFELRLASILAAADRWADSEA